VARLARTKGREADLFFARVTAAFVQHTTIITRTRERGRDPSPASTRPSLPRSRFGLRCQSLIVGGVADHGSIHQHSSTRTPIPFSTTRVSIPPAPRDRARIETHRSGNVAARKFPVT
jgi:hypothetical protein